MFPFREGGRYPSPPHLLNSVVRGNSLKDLWAAITYGQNLDSEVLTTNCSLVYGPIYRFVHGWAVSQGCMNMRRVWKTLF
jgi:hypothetical protein